MAGVILWGWVITFLLIKADMGSWGRPWAGTNGEKWPKMTKNSIFRLIAGKWGGNTAGEFWSHWLQYLAIFTIFRNFFFILYLAPAIICNVVDWSADSKLYLGKFSYHAGPIFTHIPAPEKKRGCKISEMAPFDLDEFLPENAFFDFKKVYIFIWTPNPL